MKVLIVGQGGREHAMAWKIANSPIVTQVYVAPGNAGTALENKVTNVAIDAVDIERLIDFAKSNNINLTIVGPEAPLIAGIVDRFQQAQLKCFGPNQQAAQLEGSKAFSKQFMEKYQIPTAQYATFTEHSAALNYLKSQKMPIVIKADGLAAGKGVCIANSIAEAKQAIEAMLVHGQFGNASKKIIIEEFLSGEEASFMVVTDGKHVIPLATSKDHKTRDDGGKGPNTGGMGAYSPAPIITPELHQRIMQEIIQPTIIGLNKQGITYRGFLYAGLMISKEGEPKVLEYNCRLGDPETQAILFRLKSDFYQLCDAALHDQLSTLELSWNEKPAIAVVMAAKGYPFSYPKGQTIHGLENFQKTTTANSKVFHAGTKQSDDGIITNGGRVLAVTTLGDTMNTAYEQVYADVKKIHWQDCYYRSDIGL